MKINIYKTTTKSMYGDYSASLDLNYNDSESDQVQVICKTKKQVNKITRIIVKALQGSKL